MDMRLLRNAGLAVVLIGAGGSGAVAGPGGYGMLPGAAGPCAKMPLYGPMYRPYGGPMGPYGAPMRPYGPPGGAMPGYRAPQAAVAVTAPRPAPVVASRSAGAGVEAGESAAITIEQMRFSLPTVTVRKGGSVTWQNSEGMPHTVTANDGSFGSGRLTQGDSYSRTFEQTGTFGYYCSLHPMMRGEVVVVD
jgi:plastocyanin